MGVAADDKVEPASTLRKVNVKVVSDVGESDDTLNLAMALLDSINGALDGDDGVFEGGSDIGLGDFGGCVGGYGNNGEGVLVEDFVGDKLFFEGCVGGFDVCGDGREGEVLEEGGEVGIAIVELVVTVGSQWITA